MGARTDIEPYGVKTMFLLRGLPGSGKSTMANVIQRSFMTCSWYEADMFWYTEVGDDYTKYDFDINRLHEAHQWCQSKVESILKMEQPVIVSNTFTTEKELKPYYKLAEFYGYKVVSLVVENRHGGKNIHDVPEEVLDKMEKRFSLKLK